MTDANLAKPQAFETKDLPGGYAPAPVPEFHQETRDPGYANSAGADGDEAQDWPASDSVAGRFGEQTKGADTPGSPEDSEKKTSGTRSGSKAAASSK